jgi:hypothetical protein
MVFQASPSFVYTRQAVLARGALLKLPYAHQLACRICGLIEPLNFKNGKKNPQAAQEVTITESRTPRGSVIVYAKADTGAEFEGFANIDRRADGTPRDVQSGALLT